MARFSAVLMGPLALCFAGPAHASNVPYWIQPCTAAIANCEARDPELAQWALQAWESASAGKLAFTHAASRDAALIRIVWASAETGMYGEARPISVNGRRGTEVYVRPAPLQTSDPLLRDAIVYLTCLHESGHALGLVHTAEFADIMYSFQFGGDIAEYFARYRRRLHSRADIQHNSGISQGDLRQLRQLSGWEQTR